MYSIKLSSSRKGSLSQPFRAMFILLSISALVLSSCSQSAQQHSVVELEEEELPPCEIRYGLPIDSFVMVAGQVGNNQFLADILLPHQVAYNLIDRMARDVELFDFRRLRAGNPYAVLLGPDSSAQYFVYEENKVDYLVWCFKGDSVCGYRGAKPVERKLQQASGIITGSLYNTLVNSGASAELAIRLSDVYAWSIDFYKIQAGDRFKVIYSERFVDGESIGVDSILAAHFDYRGRAFTAIRYDQDGLVGYFDEEGNSLKRAFLQAPLNYTRISSRYSKRRFHPVQKTYKAHLGTDYAAPTGTPIRTTGDGVIESMGYTGGNGNYIKVKHNGVYSTQYLHMSKFASGMKTGKAVKQGDVIGYVGSTGLATGPHLCYRFWKNGQQVDPFMEKLPAAFPINEENKAVFQALASRWIAELEKMEYPEINPAEEEEDLQMAAIPAEQSFPGL